MSIKNDEFSITYDEFCIKKALAELPKLVTLNERRRPLETRARARALPMGLEEEEEEDGEGGSREGGRESSGGGWELQLREMSWLDWGMGVRTLPMPPASPPLATAEGHEDERVGGGPRQAVAPTSTAAHHNMIPVVVSERLHLCMYR